MVATSQPLATRAGLRALERGGTPPTRPSRPRRYSPSPSRPGNSIGGDNFAIVWKDGQRTGSTPPGRRPQTAAPRRPSRTHGARSVTVPGAVGGWAALAERYGRLGLDACLADAIDAAENGFAVTPLTAAAWARGPACPGGVPARRRAWGDRPAARARRDAPPHRRAKGRRAFYEGEVARAIASVTWLEEEDLAAYEARWVEPLSIAYRGHRCSSSRRRRRASPRWKGSACSSAPRRASPRRSAACSSRSRTRSPASGTART